MDCQLRNNNFTPCFRKNSVDCVVVHYAVDIIYFLLCGFSFKSCLKV